MHEAAPPDASAAIRVPIEARRHPFVGAVERALRHRCGFTGDGPLVVGVSGGADSVALLAACLVLRGRAGGSGARPAPVAVHVHHHLRGAGADEDAAFVEALCSRHGIPVYVEHVAPAALAGNVAANARALRYEALARVARAVGARAVAVAHHADDQLETILIALCRGGSLPALSGMRWARPLGAEDLHLLRPLLGERRAACASFCRAAGLAWRDDPGNDDPGRVRGRLRRDVLPVLEALWPQAPARATAAADAIEAARVALEAAVAAAFGPPSGRRWSRSALADLGAPVLAAGLRRAALDAAPHAADDIGQRHLTLAAELIRAPDRHPRRLDWPGGLALDVRADTITLRARSHA